MSPSCKYMYIGMNNSIHVGLHNGHELALQDDKFGDSIILLSRAQLPVCKGLCVWYYRLKLIDILLDAGYDILIHDYV